MLPAEALRWLDPQPGGRFVDMTLGCGGHAQRLLEAVGTSGFILGIDRDAELLDETLTRLRDEGYGPERFEARTGNFADIDVLLGARDLLEFDGFIADVGANSEQFDRPERGFSFREAGPLDMRFDRSSGKSLKELLEDLDEKGLQAIVRDYGEERFAGRVARAIVAARSAGRLTDTAALAETIREAYPAPARRTSRIDPATRTFQALRIAVNDELTSIRTGLVKVLNGMKPGARLAVISFHSLEDRIVKRLFRSVSEGEKDFYGHRAEADATELTRKAVRPGDEEIATNPRSRSARMRGIEKRASGPIVADGWEGRG